MVKKGNGKVAFAWLPSPIGGMKLVHQEFMDCFLGFANYDLGNRRVLSGYNTAGTGYIASGRNMLVDSFMAMPDKPEWLLMLDWDVLYTPEDVYTLLDAADPKKRPIISGCYVTYFGSDEALRPCWMGEDPTGMDKEETLEDFKPYPVTTFEAGAIIPLKVAGMGFTLMHRTALEKIAKMYPDDTWKWFGHDVINGEHTGEDVTFGWRAKKAGLKVWGHGGVQLGHIKSKTLDARDMLNPAFNKTTVRVDKKVLNVGGGPGTVGPEYRGWSETSLDINPEVEPDIIADARYMAKVQDKFDAVFCSHNIEHYEEQDVPKVLRNFQRVLNPDGVVDIRTPDLGVIKQHLKTRKETDVAYTSPAGPITYYDMLNGHQASIKAGNEYMKHHTMFTKSSLTKALKDAGFRDIKVDEGNFELRAIGVR